MSQFLKVKTAAEVLAILEQLKPLGAEPVELEWACGRVLAEAVTAPEPVPHFDRAVMDGYAVRARDTFGASETLPALLEVSGEISMGRTASLALEPGKAIAIPTGGMLPAGADAVVMVEYTYPLDERTIEVSKPVAPGDNVLRVGEDVSFGEKLFDAGRRLRPQDVGVLAALGFTTVDVRRRPRVAILSTGDEIVPVSTKTVLPGKIRDINSFTISGQVEESGGLVGTKAVIGDKLESLVEACRAALADHDVVLLSGGSSVGVRDFTLRIVDHFPHSELLFHGVAIRPGKPTLMARMGEKIFWGLPGQPVSAMMIFNAFVRPCLSILQGAGGIEESGRRAVLSRQVPSVHGRTDYMPVVVSRNESGLLATPVFGKSAMISTLARSDGYIVIPEHVEGLDQGEEVTVYLFS